MTKHMLRGLTMMLLAAPVAFVACDSSDNKGDAAVTTPDAGPDGGKLDGQVVAPDVAPVSPDVLAAGPEVLPSDAPVNHDVAQTPDAAVGDTSVAVTPDATPAVDTVPVVVCTEAVKFSGGNVKTDRTLTKACSPYAIKSALNVEKGATLTIEPGTVVKFDTNQQLYIYAGAIVNAVGTAADPIVFTSSKSVPAAGDWQGVELANGSNSVTLKYVTIAYAGYGDNAALDVTDSASDIENCIIRDNAAVGINATGAVKGTKVLGNSFYSNGDLPLIISDNVQADATNAFHNGTLVNARQYVAFSGSLTTTRTFDITEVPYLFQGDFSVEKTANLTIAAGATLAFASGVNLYVYAGAIVNAVGTATAPIVFTSSKAVPAQGDWEGISFANGASSITIKYATIQYAGFGERYAVEANDSTFDIENCTIQHNLSGGLNGDNSVRATLKNNTFSDNNADGTTIANWSMEGATNATVSGNT